MLRVGATTTAIIVCCWTGAWSQQTAAPTGVSTISYDNFMRLDIKQRSERFPQLSAENMAMIVRTHGERWLAKNRARLDRSEIAVFEEAIAFVTPQLYEKPLDPRVMKKEEDVKASLRCRVNPDDVLAVFDVFGRSDSTAAQARWTYLSRARCWIGWFAESIVDYLPPIPR